jgi:hypothetical protein
MVGDEIHSLIKMAGNIAIILIDGRDVLIMWNFISWMSEFIAFGTTHDCGDAMFFIYLKVLLSVLRFSAASMLLM